MRPIATGLAPALVVLTSLGVGLTAGCVDRLVQRPTLDLIERSLPAIEAESDPDLAEAAAAPAIVQLQGFHAAWGPSPRLTLLLARATCGYAAGFVADHEEDAALRGDAAAARALSARARALLGRCARWALEGLGDRFAAILDAQDGEARAILAAAGAADAPPLYWLGVALAASIGVDPDDPKLLALAPRVIAILERVVVLDDGIDHGRAHVILGILYAAQSAAVGGEPARGRAHFERALALTGGRLLLARVMMARTYAVSTRDPALFDRLLAEVLRTPASSWPEQRLDNELAQRKARRYQAHRDRWF
jgi:hypothetical protein